MYTLNNRNIKVYSFDVFDTVVTRITAHPRAVFLLIQEELKRSEKHLSACLVDNFHVTRIEAERTARKLSSTEDVTIREIYDVIKKKYDLSSSCVERLISLEIRVESKAIKVIPETVRLISELRKTRVRIVFVSDMYLPVDVLERILSEKGVFKEGDGLYVSGHMGLAKRTGSLFKKVLHLEKLHPSELFHLGDNRRSDYRKALKNGISSVHLERGCLNRYERMLVSSKTEDSSWLQWQLLAGASRLARLQCDCDSDKRLLDLHAVGANIAGPILFGFVLWLFDEAEKKNLDKLYFLARDGQVLFEIAQILNQYRNNKFTLKYLYSSRQAWHLPAVTELGLREIEWITEKYPYITLRILALRIGADPDALFTLCSCHGFPVDDVDKHLDNAQVNRFAELLASDCDLIDLVLNNAEKARVSTIAYLKQEGLFDSSSLAIVDSGLFGRSQDSLRELMNLAGWRGDIHGFYFGIVDPLAAQRKKHGYFFSPSHAKHFRRWGRGFMTLLELMTAANHGATLSYYQSGGKWEPALSETYANVDRPGELCALRSGIINFVNMESLPSDGYDLDDYRKKTLEIMKSFYLSPSTEQAEVLGDLHFTTDQTEREGRKFAPRITIIEACRLILLASNKSRFHITYWNHGSRVRSNVYVRYLLAITSFLFRIKNGLVDKVKQRPCR